MRKKNYRSIERGIATYMYSDKVRWRFRSNKEGIYLEKTFDTYEEAKAMKDTVSYWRKHDPNWKTKCRKFQDESTGHCTSKTYNLDGHTWCVDLVW